MKPFLVIECIMHVYEDELIFYTYNMYYLVILKWNLWQNFKIAPCRNTKTSNFYANFFKQKTNATRIPHLWKESIGKKPPLEYFRDNSPVDCDHVSLFELTTWTQCHTSNYHPSYLEFAIIICYYILNNNYNSKYSNQQIALWWMGHPVQGCG